MAEGRIRVRMPDGTVYGPVTQEELARWQRERRVPAGAVVEDMLTGEKWPAAAFDSAGQTVLSPLVEVPAPASTRPREATVIAVLLLVFSAITLVSVPFYFTPMAGSSLAEIYGPPVLLLNIAGDTLAALGFLISGIGLLKMRPWARRAAVYLLDALCVLVLITGTIGHVKLSALRAVGGSDPMANIEVIGGLIGLWVGTVVILVINGLVIYFLTRRHVVDAFDYPSVARADREVRTVP